MSTAQAPHYSIVIQWSDEDQIYVVSLPEWGALTHTHGATYEAALRQGEELLQELIAARKDAGEPLPQPQTYATHM